MNLTAEQKKTVATVVGQTARTTATTVGEASRLAASTAGTATAAAVASKAGKKSVIQDAAKAFSGTYASVASIACARPLVVCTRGESRMHAGVGRARNVERTCPRTPSASARGRSTHQ